MKRPLLNFYSSTMTNWEKSRLAMARAKLTHLAFVWSILAGRPKYAAWWDYVEDVRFILNNPDTTKNLDLYIEEGIVKLAADDILTEADVADYFKDIIAAPDTLLRLSERQKMILKKLLYDN